MKCLNLLTDAWTDRPILQKSFAFKKVQDIFKARYKLHERGEGKKFVVHIIKGERGVFVCVAGGGGGEYVCVMLFVVINQARGSKVNNSLEKQFLTFLMIFLFTFKTTIGLVYKIIKSIFYFYNVFTRLYG